MYAFQALNTRFLCFMEVEAIKSMYGQQFHHVLVYINVLFPREKNFASVKTQCSVSICSQTLKFVRQNAAKKYTAN